MEIVLRAYCITQFAFIKWEMTVLLTQNASGGGKGQYTITFQTLFCVFTYAYSELQYFFSI